MTGPEPFHLAASVLLLLAPCLLFFQAVYAAASPAAISCRIADLI